MASYGNSSCVIRIADFIHTWIFTSFTRVSPELGFHVHTFFSPIEISFNIIRSFSVILHAYVIHWKRKVKKSGRNFCVSREPYAVTRYNTRVCYLIRVNSIGFSSGSLREDTPPFTGVQVINNVVGIYYYDSCGGGGGEKKKRLRP